MPLVAQPAEDDRSQQIEQLTQKTRLSHQADPDEPRGAENIRAEKYTIHIPEPMVFDLVRGLGARQGELEVNVLGIFPLRKSDPREVMWAPEIEGTIADGIALEFELPFEGSHLEAYKFAGQLTFGTALQNHFIHGSQVIAEKFKDEDIWETTVLYIPGARLNETFSMISLIGFRHASGDDIDNDTELIFNFSVFADVAARTSVGVESNYASGLNGEAATLRLMPQVHFEITGHSMIQAGVGLFFKKNDTYPEAASRLIYTF